MVPKYWPIAGDPSTLSLDIVLSYIHWDHIQGFPFFGPAYIPGAQLRIWGCHDTIETTLRRQHAAPTFPVDFEQLGAEIEFRAMERGEHYRNCGFDVVARQQGHPGVSFGYRINRDGRDFVYATGIEHKIDDTDEVEACEPLFKDADIVVFDAMFGWGEALTIRRDWGHSSNIMGVDLCLMAKARHLILFHHDPRNSDDALHQALLETQEYLKHDAQEAELGISSAGL